MKKLNVLIAIVAVFMMILACGESGDGDVETPAEAEVTVEAVAEESEIAEPASLEEATEVAESAPTVEPTIEPEPTDTPVPTDTPEPTATPDPNLIKPGTYIVGTDIQPGIYRGEAGTDTFDSCYWARLAGLSGEFDDLITNDNSIGQFYVEVQDTDHALETGCELTLLSLLPEPSGDLPTNIMPGTYLLGRDIQPGIYRGETGTDTLDSCYWARLAGLSGDFDDLITNDNSIGQFYVEVQDTDYAVATGCELTLLSALPEPSGDLPTNIMPGTYIVGRDIQAGTYRGEAGTDTLDSCYWARLAGLSGEFDALITNDNSNGQFFVEVQESDFALSTACELEKVEG